MRMRYLAAGAFALVAAVGLSACHDDNDYAQAPVAAPVVQAAPGQAPVYAQQPPVIVQQPSNDGFWQGYMMAHLLGGYGHTTVIHHYSPAPVIHNTTVINKTVTVTRPAPVYRAPASTYRPSTSYSSYRSSGYSSFRGGRR